MEAKFQPECHQIIFIIHSSPYFLLHFRRCGQVPAAAEVPVAQDHLGRRGDGLLLQGEVAKLAQGNVQGKRERKNLSAKFC